MWGGDGEGPRCATNAITQRRIPNTPTQTQGYSNAGVTQTHGYSNSALATPTGDACETLTRRCATKLQAERSTLRVQPNSGSPRGRTLHHNLFRTPTLGTAEGGRHSNQTQLYTRHKTRNITRAMTVMQDADVAPAIPGSNFTRFRRFTRRSRDDCTCDQPTVRNREIQSLNLIHGINTTARSPSASVLRRRKVVDNTLRRLRTG